MFCVNISMKLHHLQKINHIKLQYLLHYQNGLDLVEVKVNGLDIIKMGGQKFWLKIDERSQ